MRSVLSAGAAIAASLLVAPAAQAATYLITFTGTASAYDNVGLFGTAKKSYTNVAFTTVYTLSYPNPGTLTLDDADERNYVGYFANNAMTATLTINGITKSIQSLQTNVYYTNNNALNNYDALEYRVSSDDYVNGVYYDDVMWNNLFDPTKLMLSSTEFLGSFDYTVNNPVTGSGSFRFQNSRDGYQAYGEFLTKTISIRTVEQAVPEPASWAIMIGGLGLVGASMRRRRATMAVQFS